MRVPLPNLRLARKSDGHEIDVSRKRPQKGHPWAEQVGKRLASEVVENLVLCESAMPTTCRHGVLIVPSDLYGRWLPPDSWVGKAVIDCQGAPLGSVYWYDDGGIEATYRSSDATQ